MRQRALDRARTIGGRRLSSSSRSKSRSTAARSWRASKARRCLCRWLCPASRRGCASLTASAATRPPKWKRSSRHRSSGLRPRARTLAHVAAASISTQTTLRNSLISRKSCARRWSVAACTRRKISPCWLAEPWAYRNRIRLAFDANGDAGYRGRRSHAVIPIAECPIAAPLLVRAALAASRILRESPTKLRVNEISLFCDAAETALLVSVTVAGIGKRCSTILRKPSPGKFPS